jgi:hypothetical protein
LIKITINSLTPPVCEWETKDLIEQEHAGIRADHCERQIEEPSSAGNPACEPAVKRPITGGMLMTKTQNPVGIP